MDKPAKPYPDFPLGAATNGQWRKKINGKTQYFGPWNDPLGALARYQALVGDEPAAPSDDKPTNLPSAKPPAKPHKDFPLFAHPNGQWAKKIRQKSHYFGPWSDPQVALDKWLLQKDHLLAGRKPKVVNADFAIGRLINMFLTEKRLDVEKGTLSTRTFADYDKICERILKVFDFNRQFDDLDPEDYGKLRDDFATTHNAVALFNDIQKSMVFFNYAAKQCNCQVNRGDKFKKPTRKVLRKDRRGRHKKLFQPIEIRKMLESATPPLKAMIFLGINCGFGNGDCAMLTKTYLDLDKGYHSFPRPKTDMDRECYLWPETVAAIKAAIDSRPSPIDPEHENHVFITSGTKRPWTRNAKNDDPITKEFTKLTKKLGIHKPRVGFYSLRHTFYTIGKRRNESVADFIMGHVAASDDMSAVYNEETFDVDLRGVAKYVRRWLYGLKAHKTRSHRNSEPAASAESAPAS